MNYALCPPLRVPEGEALAGGSMETYLAGTSTPLATYADNVGTANPTTIPLNTSGRPDGAIYLATIGANGNPVAYKFIVKDVNGATVYTQDDVRAGGLQLFDLGNVVNLEDFATLQDAITAIGSSVRTLVVSTVKAVAANTTVPSNISLLFIGEGQLSVASGISVTISSRPMADPRRQIFGGSGTVTFAAEATDELWLEWWGADSTGATDSTTAIAAWLSAAQDSEIRARVGSGSFLYSGSGFSLSSRFPGIVGNGIFQTQFHADISAGQTALTVNMSGRTGLYSGFSVWAGAPGESVATARATARNGILWTGNGGQCHIADVKVYNFAGFGQKFEDIFDTIIDNMIVESCGNATEYAWSVTQSVGTSNHLQFNRPQVELSYEKAIYVHPNTLSCVFLGLHSERTTGNGVDYTHVLNAGSWLAARIEATSDVYLKIGGPNGSYRDFRCPDVAVEFSYGAAGQCVIDNLSCASLYVLPSNVVKCTARNLKISGELRIETGNFVVRDSVGLTHLNLYGNSAIVQMFNCAVSGSHSVTGNPSLTAVDCTFAEAPPYDGVNLYRCTLNGAWTMPAAQKIVAVDCTFTAAITLAVTGTRFRARNCDFQAALGYSSGDAFGILDAACIVGSTVAAEWYGAPSAGTWVAGDRRYDPLPSAGGVEGSICVAAGTPGTWKNLGSVAL